METRLKLDPWNRELLHEQRSGSREAAIRLILERGNQRLRKMYNQGRRVQGAERLLNLMRDLRVVPLDGMTIKIPLVYADVWQLNTTILDYLTARRKDFLTMFARPTSTGQSDPAANELNEILVNALNEYMYKNKRCGLLLDLVRRNPLPQMREGNQSADLDFSLTQSEARRAFFDCTRGISHPLFAGIEDRLPDLLLEVQALIRIIFPLTNEIEKLPQSMGTIVMGIALEDSKEKNLDCFEDPALIEQVRELAQVLIQEIPLIYRYFEETNGKRNGRTSSRDGIRQRTALRESGGNESIEQTDDLHNAIDQLHMQIADLAYRLDLKDWRNLGDPSQGYNFLVAFRKLDRETLRGRLSYRLTKFNRQALAHSIKSGALVNEQNYENLSQATIGRFVPGNAKKDESERRDFVRRSLESMKRILKDGRGDALSVLVKEIENSDYPLDLTPGYHVMSLGYPEIVKNWLRDPRAKGFGAYPPVLLAWESLALPQQTDLYYSPIADGSIYFGVCGVNANLLYRGGGPELQELIDNSGPWLRDIICNDLIYELKRTLFKNRSRGLAGYELWDDALWHFRQLAYFYLPGGKDYFTLLIDERQAEEMDNILKRGRIKWRTAFERSSELKLNWEELSEGIPNEVVDYMLSVHSEQPGIPHGGSREGFFFMEHLSGHPNLENAQLYRVKLMNARGFRLLILVPERRYRQPMTSLISRFSMAYESALASYNDDSFFVVSNSELMHQCVYLMPLLRQALSECTGSTEAGRHSRLMAEVIQNEMNYFTNKIAEIVSGPPITISELFELMSDIASTISWGLQNAQDPYKGYLEDVCPESVLTLTNALAHVTRNDAFRKVGERDTQLSRSAALLLFWEIALNLCKHSDAEIKFATAHERAVRLSIESRSKTTPVRISGRYGVTQLQKVAGLLGVGFNCGPRKDNPLLFHADIVFKSEVVP